MPLLEPVPDLRALDLLRSVDELGSISRAASAHSVSQPAASMRLRSLERTLGVALLDRSRGPARLSAAGVAVVGWSQPLLGAMESLLAGTAAVRSDGQTHLRVVASMTVAEYLVPGWLQQLRGSNPEIAVSLQMGNSHDVIALMEEGRGDLGFVEGPKPTTAVLHSRIVHADDLAVVVAPTHPWAKRRSPLLPAELARTPLVLRESGSGTREVFEGALGVLGLEPIAAVELGSTTAIKAAVISGAGPAVLSRLAVQVDVDEGRLAVVEVRDLSLARSIRAVWRRDDGPTALASRLLRQIGIRL